MYLGGPRFFEVLSFYRNQIDCRLFHRSKLAVVFGTVCTLPKLYASKLRFNGRLKRELRLKGAAPSKTFSEPCEPSFLRDDGLLLRQLRRPL